MIQEEKIKIIKSTANLISDLIDTEYHAEYYLLDDLNAIIDKYVKESIYAPLLAGYTDEEIEFLRKNIISSKMISFGTSVVICEEADDWFDKIPVDPIDNHTHFGRYKKYLQDVNGFSTTTLDELSSKTLNPIMNHAGNPKLDSFDKRGLVIGDVQSGKTLNFIGLINKAFDAGYKLAIVLTGTIEALRQQTQKRIDYGVVGFNSDVQTDATVSAFIGVGEKKYNPTQSRFTTALTTRETDFNGPYATKICISLNEIATPVILVVKKQVSTLKKIYEWLGKQHSLIEKKPQSEWKNPDKEEYKTIKQTDFPLFVIDDEADYASINTKDDENNPTFTNAWIRKILGLFKKQTYIGFTATPFANIFINHETDVEEYGKDLFPKDFIVNIEPPKSYIGANEIFLEDGKYQNSIIYEDICPEVKSSKSRYYTPFKAVPDSMKKALYDYFISNVIRDLRGDTKAHRAMLINISMTIDNHFIICEKVTALVEKILQDYYLHCKVPPYTSKFIEETKQEFEKEYSHCGYDWEDILKRLPDSNIAPSKSAANRIQVLIVNSANKMIDYEDYKETGARLILIGGFSLSRGLTLEGLCVSYFSRNSKTFDTLFQMGRWFGYRPNYEDLFRVYMPEELVGWYKGICSSMEELKDDVRRMRDAGKKPIEFGLRVKNDVATLKITAKNKMLYAEDGFKTVIGYGSVIPTPDIYCSPKINQENLQSIENLLKTDMDTYGLKIETDEVSKNKIIHDVSLETILQIINTTDFPEANDFYNKQSLIEFLKNPDFLDKMQKWDVVFAEGRKTESNKDKVFKFLGEDIYLTGRQFDKRSKAVDYLRIQGSIEQLHNPRDTRAGLDKDIYDSIVEEEKQYFESDPKNKTKTWSESRIPSVKYLIKDRKPMLLIYVIDLKIIKNENEAISEEVYKDFEEAKVHPVGIALGIPRLTDVLTAKTLYKVNTVAQQGKAEDIVIEYEED